MKILPSILKTVLVSAVIAGAINSMGQTSTSSAHKTVSATANANLSVRTENGQSVVTLNGKEIYASPLQGQVTSRSSNVNGVEYTAAFDGDKVLWENVPGAAKQLQSGGGAAAGLDHKQFMEEHQKTVDRMLQEEREFMEAHGGTNVAHSVSQSGNAAISTKIVNGSTVIVYQGQEFSVGPTQGPVSAKAKSIDGKNYAAAFDGDRVIWENVPGAAQQVK